MNEQIYKLSRQADALARKIVPNLREIVLYDRVRDEQLVQLVVRDVLAICDQTNKNFEAWTEQHAIDSMQRQIGVNHLRVAIKQHFGVEE